MSNFQNMIQQETKNSINDIPAVSMDVFEEVKEVKKKQMTIYASVELSNKIKTVAITKNQNASRVVEELLEKLFAEIKVEQDKVEKYDEKYRKGKGRK